MPKTLTRRNGVVLILAAWSALNAGGAPERVPAPSVRPALLDAAFHAYIEDQGRWAYTETRGGKHHNGSPVAETIVLVDPSRRYVEQYVPVKFQGQEPPEKIRRAWAEYGETLARRRQERIDAGKMAEVGDAEFRLKVNGRDVVPDLGHAVVIAGRGGEHHLRDPAASPRWRAVRRD